MSPRDVPTQATCSILSPGVGVLDKYTPENTNPQFSQSVSQSVVHKQHARLCRQEWEFWINTMRPRPHRGAPKRSRGSLERPRGVSRKGQRFPREVSTQATCLIMSAGIGVPDKYTLENTNPQFSQSVSQSVVHKQHAGLRRQKWGFWINTIRPRAHRGASKRSRAPLPPKASSSSLSSSS